jgi:hypothetical protein
VSISFRAERPGAIPDAGRPVVAGVELPDGVQCGEDGPAYWSSTAAVEDIAGRCTALATAFAHTGLWPLAWSPAETLPEDFYLPGHGSIEAVDALDPAAVVAQHWDRTYSHGDVLGLGGPGLAEGSARPSTPLSPAQRFAPLRGRLSLVNRSPERRLVLVPCRRPADVFAALNPEIESPLTNAEITALLRSWEERFDAVPIEIDELVFTFSVGAPATTAEQALRLGAEFQVAMPTYDWCRPDGPRNVVSLLLHGTRADPEFMQEAELTPDLWQLAPQDD